MVRIHPDPPPSGSRSQARREGPPCTQVHQGLSNEGWRSEGAVAQLGEHLLCKQGVVGSIPISSTSLEAGEGRGQR